MGSLEVLRRNIINLCLMLQKCYFSVELLPKCVLSVSCFYQQLDVTRKNRCLCELQRNNSFHWPMNVFLFVWFDAWMTWNDFSSHYNEHLKYNWPSNVSMYILSRNHFFNVLPRQFGILPALLWTSAAGKSVSPQTVLYNVESIPATFTMLRMQ